MNNKNNDSITKLNTQIKKLIEDSDYITDQTPILNKKDLDKRVKLAKLDKQIEDNKKKVNNTLTKQIKTNKTSEQREKEKIEELKKLYAAKKPVNKDKKLKRKHISRKNIKQQYQNKKEQVNMILDDQDKVDKIIKLLSYIFGIMLAIIIIFLIIICTI